MHRGYFILRDDCLTKTWVKRPRYIALDLNDWHGEFALVRAGCSTRWGWYLHITVCESRWPTSQKLEIRSSFWFLQWLARRIQGHGTILFASFCLFSSLILSTLLSHSVYSADTVLFPYGFPTQDVTSNLFHWVNGERAGFQRCLCQLVTIYSS